MPREEFPTTAVEAAISAGLRVLLQVRALRCSVTQDIGKAHAVDTLHWRAMPLQWPRHTGQLHQCGVQIRYVRVLAPNTTLCLTSRPRTEKRHSDSARECLALVQPEGRIGCHAPAARVVHGRAGPANQVQVTGHISLPVAWEARRGH